MAFHDVKFPDDVAWGARGGPRFKTQVSTLYSGVEKRNIDWSKARAEYDVSHQLRDDTEWQALLDFFYARQGKAHSFRFKDHTDYTMPVQTIGTGDNAETNFQLVKVYTSGAVTYTRTLEKIVSGTTQVYFDTVEQLSGWTVNLLTGIVNFSVAPSGGVDITANCQFDVPCRFDNDEMAASLEHFQRYNWDAVTLMEVKGE